MVLPTPIMTASNCDRTALRVTNHAGRETAADGPRRSVAGAHRCTPSAALPPGDAASVTVREGRGGDATSKKAAGESESDIRARVGGEEQEPRGDGDGSKGDDAATRGPPRAATPNTFTCNAGSEGARPDDDVAPAEDAGGGEPGGGAS